MNLYQQQASNRRWTWAVMAGFAAFLAFLGYGFDLFYLGIPYPVAGLVALIIGLVSVWHVYRYGDREVLGSVDALAMGPAMAAAVSDEQRLKLTQLQNVTEEMAIAAGIPRPRLYLIFDTDPNAFATGRGPGYASIAMTQGLLDALNREELQGVVAHEMSHIRNYDIRLMTVVAGLVGAITLLSDWVSRDRQSRVSPARSESRDDKDGGGAAAVVFFILWIIAIVLAPIIAQILAMMVSRQRESLADASGAELTRNPEALASALQKIEAAVAPTQSIKRGVAHLCIADPLGRKMGLREGFWADLLATHPPMAKRIAALRAMAYLPPAPAA
jgi:heat shock protein HtpX